MNNNKLTPIRFRTQFMEIMPVQMVCSGPEFAACMTKSKASADALLVWAVLHRARRYSQPVRMETEPL